MAKPASRQRGVDREERFGDVPVVRERQPPAPRELTEARACLDRELVAGQMRDPEIGKLERLVARLAGRLPGQPEDEVGRDPRHAGPDRAADGGRRAPRVVETPEKAQALVSKRLDADRQSIHPHIEERTRPVLIERRRVALDGDLEVSAHRGESDPLADARKDAAEVLGFPEAGGTPPEEDALDATSLDEVRPRVDFTEHRVGVSGVIDVRCDVADEVAIRDTLPGTTGSARRPPLAAAKEPPPARTLDCLASRVRPSPSQGLVLAPPGRRRPGPRSP